MQPHPPRWRVGDLAKLAGLTVRTLHHYEAIGLLGPPARGEGGHRLYDEAALQRLYRVRVLRDLGLALAEIRQAIDDEAALPEVMRQHLARVEQEVAELTRLRDHLRRLIQKPGPDTDDLLQTLAAMTRLEHHVATRGQPGQGRAWKELGNELRACLEAKEDPAAERPQALAARARELLHAFAGGDPDVLAALAHIRQAAPPEALAGWDPPLFAYLDRALGGSK